MTRRESARAGGEEDYAKEDVDAQNDASNKKDMDGQGRLTEMTGKCVFALAQNVQNDMVDVGEIRRRKGQGRQIPARKW